MKVEMRLKLPIETLRRVLQDTNIYIYSYPTNPAETRCSPTCLKSGHTNKAQATQINITSEEINIERMIS